MLKRPEKTRHCYFPTGWRFISEEEKPWSSLSDCNSPLDLPTHSEESPKHPCMTAPRSLLDLDVESLPHFSLPEKVRLGYHSSRVDLKTLLNSKVAHATFPHTEWVLQQKLARKYRLKPPDAPRQTKQLLKKEYMTAWYMPKSKWRVGQAQKVRTHDMKLDLARNVYERLHETHVAARHDERLDENRRKLSRMLGYRMYMEYFPPSYLDHERLRVPPGLRDVPQFEI